MKTKRIYIDIESTGTARLLHGIHQISGLIEIDGKVVDKFNYYVKPFSHRKMDPEALEISGVTAEQISHYPPARDVHAEMQEYFEEMSDKYHPNMKFTVIGYGVGFDMDFLSDFFIHSGSLQWGILQNWRFVDVMAYVRILVEDFGDKRLSLLSNHKLGTLAHFFGLQHNPHEAESDVEVTYHIHKGLKRRLEMAVKGKL